MKKQLSTYLNMQFIFYLFAQIKIKSIEYKKFMTSKVFWYAYYLSMKLFCYCNYKMIQQKRESKNFEAIKVLQRKHYGCLAKIFCCKCIHACQDLDFSLLTSANRKDAFQKMIKKYIRKLHQNKKLNVIMDPFFILVALLLGQDSQVYSQLMSIINNQTQPIVFSKQDLEFYIPQLCTYLVFHQELKNMQLQKLLVRACKVDIHFSLKYYFYMKSLQIFTNGQQITKYERVSKYNCQFRNMISHYYQSHKSQKCAVTTLSPVNQAQEEPSIVLQKANSSESKYQNNLQDKQNIRSSSQPIDHSNEILRLKKQTNQQVELSEHDYQVVKQNREATKWQIKANKLRQLKQPNIYQSFLVKSIENHKSIFQSTINFFSDLVQLSRILVSSANRDEDLKINLESVNKRLPATIYIPFTKNYYQNLNIVSILFNESRIFKTKQRAPFYVCFESFSNPTYNQGISKDRKIRSTTQVKKDIKKSNMFEDQFQQEQDMRQSRLSTKSQRYKPQSDDRPAKSARQSKVIKAKLKGWNKYFNLSKIKRAILQKKNEKQPQKEREEKQEEEEKQQEIQEDQAETKTEAQNSEQACNQLVNKNNQQKYIEAENYFGQSSEDQFQRIKLNSQYSCLTGYKLIHVIIKSNDDLRQQNFAMQLLQEFDTIFRMEKLSVQLSPYQVLPLSHQAGIMQCVRDSITIDSLRKQGGSLRSLLNTKAKMKNFINSLVGYSLVTYFLQVKDRHNGNIMIKSNGSIFHIDYGFFMTNAPGKGVQLQKNLPFKLTNQYVQALGGLESSHFQSFRLLFYKAFNACRKHQHRILILTKLMYSSYGKTMPCFVKGDQSIQKLEGRFNPPGITNDAGISAYCQNLINSSIDNWRSRWYDKWQYYAQGIFY